MATVFDIAAYILKHRGKMTAMKLHKLLYYAQAWSLVWDEKPLFISKIEAWANGPVVPRIYAIHRGSFEASPKKFFALGRLSVLSDEQKETVDAVLEFYGNKSSQYLSELTHAERPWSDARAGLAPGARGNNEITYSAMFEYYGSL